MNWAAVDSTPAEEGEPCAASVADAEVVTACADGLWCEIDSLASPATGICRAPLAAGAACDSSDDVCVEGYACLDRTSCKPIVIGARAGDACDPAAGSYCDPFARLSCVSGKCQTLGDGSTGSACATSDIHELFDCQKGLRCAGTTPGTCTPLVAVDAACEANSDCASGTCRSGVCAAAFCER